MIQAVVTGCAFLVLSLSGMYAGVPDHAHAHCPYAPIQNALCATLGSHLDHWQVSTSGVVPGMVIFAVLFTTSFAFSVLFVSLLVRNQRFRAMVSFRPPLLVELFSRGLLNPRVP